MKDETLETVTAAPRILVSYDSAARRRTACSMIHQFLFGRHVTASTKGGKKRYRYEGLIHRPGVERLGQSVWMMREEEAEELTRLLGRLGVPYRRERIWVEA